MVPPADETDPPLESGPPARPPACAAVAAATSELLLPDGGEPHLVRLRAHLRVCPRCQSDLAQQAAVIVRLRELPVAADSRKSWAGVRLALAQERRFAVLHPPRERQVSRDEWLVLAVVAAALAWALVRLSPLVARAWPTAAPFHLWLLPVLFVAFGALVSLLALPVLRLIPRSLVSRPGFR